MIDLMHVEVKESIILFEFLIKNEKTFDLEIKKNDKSLKSYKVSLEKDFNELFIIKFDLLDFDKDLNGTYNFNLIVNNSIINIYNLNFN